MNSRSGNLEQQVRAAFDGKLADVAFEGTGFGSALNNAIDCVRPFATVVMVGNPAEIPPSARSSTAKFSGKS